MPQFEVLGYGELSAALEDLANLPDELLDEMLEAESDVVESAIKAKAAAYGVEDTGQMISSIKRGPVRRIRDGKALTISPQGSRKRGNTVTRNAEIAFINEYGKGKEKQVQPARPFMRDAVEGSADEAVQAAASVYDDYLKSKNL